MKRSFSLLVPYLTAGPAFCQPVLHAMDHLPVPGTTRVIHQQEGNGIEIPTGVALTWDFTWLSTQQTVTTNYQAVVNPGLLALGATVAVDTYVPGLSTSVFGVDTGGLKDFVPGTFWMSCSEVAVMDNSILLPPSLSYGDSLVDEYASSCGNQYEAEYETGGRTVTAVGWGTLIMPWGAVDNVLQVNSVHTRFNLEMPANYQNSHYTTGMRFYHPNAVEPVVAVEYQYVHNGSSWVELGSDIYFIVEIGLGMPEALDGGFSVWPNPVTSQVSVSIKTPIASVAQFEVFDLSGRVVHQGSARIVAGTNAAVQIDMGPLAPGPYALRLSDTTGVLGTARLIKE